MAPSYIHRVVGEGGVAQSADYCSKQNSGSGRVVSLHPSLLVQGDMGKGENHSISHVYVSGEADLQP